MSDPIAEPHAAIPMPSPFASILKWSTDWPEWQRDALRRIITSGSLTENDLKELDAICRAKHGLLPETGSVLVAVPLNESHLPGGVDGDVSVSLSKISGLKNVGRLPSDQEIVFGSAPGLTVIYGENGAGKSGYARVIKKACRARGNAQEIKPDAFAAVATGPAEARIEYRVGAMSTAVDWKDGSPSNMQLGNVFVFDSFSARIHVGEDGPACFKPRGLDVLPELATACDAISEKLKKEINDALADAARIARTWTYRPTTAVGKILGSLSAETQPELIEMAAAFTGDDEKRLADVEAIRSTEPRVKSAATNAAARRIRTFAETVKSRAISMDDTAMQNIGDAIREAEVTAKAAAAAAGPELKEGDLPGSCGGVWRKLWDAAREFSIEKAYPDKAYPFTDPDAKCVLCQQLLQPDAIDRYARFDRFVLDKTREQAEAAKAKVGDLKNSIDRLRALGVEIEDVKADLERESSGVLADVELFVKEIDARVVHVQGCLREGVWSDASVLPVSPCDELFIIANRLDDRAREELAAADPEMARKLAEEQNELVDKKWLFGRKEEVKSQVGRCVHVAVLKKCQRDCVTSVITRKVGELEEIYVTKIFHAAFVEELMQIGMGHLRVCMDEAKPEPGKRRHGIRLVNSPRKPNGDPVYNARDILSEGEQRLAALAAFMAELRQASHRSALVFDDPVSSLDHARRGHVAKRLVKESVDRQVVIFTHDIVFLCELFDATEGESSCVKYMHLYWNGGRPGFCDTGLPWDWKKYADRIDALEKECRHIDVAWNSVPSPMDSANIRMAYTHLSATIERVVQDVLLAGVVERYGNYIRVGNLDKVVGISTSECDEIARIYNKCSDVTCRHDPASARNAPVPSPAELRDDINALKTLVTQVKDRRKAKGTVMQ